MARLEVGRLIAYVSDGEATWFRYQFLLESGRVVIWDSYCVLGGASHTGDTCLRLNPGQFEKGGVHTPEDLLHAERARNAFAMQRVYTYQGRGISTRVESVVDGEKYIVSTAPNPPYGGWELAVFRIDILGHSNLFKPLRVQHTGTFEEAEQEHFWTEDRVIHRPRNQWEMPSRLLIPFIPCSAPGCSRRIRPGDRMVLVARGYYREGAITPTLTDIDAEWHVHCYEGKITPQSPPYTCPSCNRRINHGELVTYVTIGEAPEAVAIGEGPEHRGYELAYIAHVRCPAARA